ncbi:unnamed protein product [Prunus armeniaca]|uniref:Uncharacterized protein n=1 Tax=Prunus armeniaca TaxID=36596 RepID=A0A6J5X1K6_PRUAR|nr:unnamed protein product [Prunus armeniaca]CAB4304718.1 unnamed protein product [Prunus armeniaca]
MLSFPQSKSAFFNNKPARIRDKHLSPKNLAGHGGSKWHQPVILPLPREGGRRCSVKPALRSALLSRNPVTQSLRSSHKVQLLAWNGRARR